MKRKIFIICCLVIFVSSFKFSYADDEIEELNNNDIVNILETSAKVEENININSRIAVAYDRESGRAIWGKDENKKTAMASTTKIMTALVVIENANLNDIVEISSRAAGTGGSRLGLKKEDKISIRDLLYGLMLRSGNDAAVALAEYVGGNVEGFANLMNKKAINLNLKNTHFVTPHGLDDPNHYTTAYELARLADYALGNETFSKIVGTKNYTISINGYPKNINNTNELLGNFVGVYGIKTGFTNNAGRCLVTAVKNETFDIITIVLQADTKKDRTNDSVKIINYIFKNFQKVDLEEIVNNEFESWCEVNKNRVNINKAKEYNIELKKDDVKNRVLVIDQNGLKSIDVDINGIFEYEAPVEKNTKFGEVKIYIGNELIEINNIYINNSVSKKDFSDYLEECMRAITYLI